MVPLQRGRPLTVGSAPDAGLRLDDPYVSTRHAVIRVARCGVVVEDRGSKNGTWVDGVTVERAWARMGAVVRLGRVTLRVVSEASARDQTEPDPADGVVGSGPAFREVRRTLERAARGRSPVLLLGETGTGKEVAARLLHRASERRNRPFVALNCGAIPEALAESELFGHVRGAFTGAHRDRVGAFARADGGTMLLDEVAELSPLTQAKLLRVLETRRILPVGAEREQPVDVRIIAATHRNMQAMIEAGKLREDLYHRLGVLNVRLPPLRERREDIPALLEHFAREAAREVGYPVEFTDAAVRAACRHSWPGNIRALRNAVLRGATLAEGPIDTSDLVTIQAPTCQEVPPGCIVIAKADYATMHRDMLQSIVKGQGSIRRAAKFLDVPRSTLGTWLRR